MRVAITLVVPLIVTGLMVFSIVDILTIARDRVQHLPKLGWVLLVVFLSFVGSLLWFLVGREPNPAGPRARPSRASRGPLAPDDDPEFLARLRREREQEERIRKLEQRLSELDDDPPE